jgi:hypothetical protein
VFEFIWFFAQKGSVKWGMFWSGLRCLVHKKCTVNLKNNSFSEECQWEFFRPVRDSAQAYRVLGKFKGLTFFHFMG